MSDIQDRLNSILSDPEAMRQVQSLGEQLGLSGSTASPAPSAPPKPEALASANNDDDMLASLSRLAPLMKSYSQSDETTALLTALSPFLSNEKQQRIEQAKRMIKMMKLLPMLKGFF